MPVVACAPAADRTLFPLLPFPRDKRDLPGQKQAVGMTAAKSALGAVKSVPNVATLILATLTGAVGCRRIQRSRPPRHCGRPQTQGDVPNPDSETGHGETVSVEDPHRQPHAASRYAHAELRLRSATVGRSRHTTGLS